MFEYLDYVVNTSEPDQYVDSIYLSNECSDYIVSLPFYGTQSSCLEDGQLKYSTCNSENSVSYDIPAIPERSLFKIPNHLSVCVTTKSLIGQSE